MKKNKTVKSSFSISGRKKLLNTESPFAVKEAYNLVRTKLMFTGKGDKCPVYAITSAEAAEGKTTNAINLAISFAMTGKKVLLIDADLRKPSINKYLEIQRKNGLSEFLAQLQKEINIQPTQQENLFVMTSGNIPPNPSELMGSPVFASMIADLSEQFDYIFIDTPPIGIVSDAALLSELVTGYILVVRNMLSDINAVHNAVETIKNLQGTVAGFLLNDADGKGGEYHKKGYGRYKYDYSYSYGENGVNGK